MNRLLFIFLSFIGIILGAPIKSAAFVTVASSAYSLEVGVDQYLPVPQATYGYIDYAVWACSSPEITFKSKDAAGAIVRIKKAFSGKATVEVMATEKYLDSFGHTRAISYYKEYIITCIGGGSSGDDEDSEIILPDQINLKVGERVQYSVVSGTWKVGAYLWSFLKSDPVGCVLPEIKNSGKLELFGVMEGRAILKITTPAGATKTSTIVITDTEQMTGRRTEKAAVIDVKALIFKVLPLINSASIKDVTIDDFAEKIDYNAAFEVYDLNGVKVADSLEGLSSGIYIIRQGGKSAKIIL